MLDLRQIRENPDSVKETLNKRGEKTAASLDDLLSLDTQWREQNQSLEELRHKKRVASDEVGKRKSQGEDASELLEELKTVSKEEGQLSGKVSAMEGEIKDLLLNIPNLPHESVPIGFPPEANEEVKSWGTPKDLGFKPRTHIELAEKLGLIDLPRGAKITGSNFILFTGLGAKLERALINFMLDIHTQQHGYTEVSPPFLVNRKTMTGTGQLPKFEEDLYGLKDEDFFLIPTAEVPVTNIHQGETLPLEDLPLCYTAYTPCFRREAGSYGKDTKGLQRVHQFDKVEMVKFVHPEESYDELESLLGNAETILQHLELPYRVITLCSGDLSFSAAKCYDVEVWSHGTDSWLEVSSCSNFEDFQARRANIRFKDPETNKPRFVHTLNGSGLALPRTLIALLETHQQRDGSVIIPEPLRPYLGGMEQLTPA